MKPIKLTAIQINGMLREAQEYLLKYKGTDSTINCKFDLRQLITEVEKPTIIFSQKAYLKMHMLVKHNTKEIAWHGIVERNNNTFTVKDILVYPQEVTGVTVETDQQEYSNWLINLPDEQFNNLRMQGHSHVNMGVSPSGTDTTWYNSILQQLQNDDYYIFLILNKSGNLHLELYDLKTNTKYDKEDIEIKIEHEDWVKEMSKLVKEPPKVNTASEGYELNYNNPYYYTDDLDKVYGSANSAYNAYKKRKYEKWKQNQNKKGKKK